MPHTPELPDSAPSIEITMDDLNAPTQEDIDRANEIAARDAAFNMDVEAYGARAEDGRLVISPRPEDVFDRTEKPKDPSKAFWGITSPMPADPGVATERLEKKRAAQNAVAAGSGQVATKASRIIIV